MTRKRNDEKRNEAAVTHGEPGSHDHGDAVWTQTPTWVSDPIDPGNGQLDAALDEWLDDTAPTLHQFLVLQGWGGRARKPGTVRIFAEEGKWKACLNDNEGGRYAFLSGTNLMGLLQVIEKALAGRGVDWRANKKWK